MLGILGSRGCVRNCTFCDVHEHWNKFQWRSAESIFNEMMHQYHSYGINIFLFSDSLVNGNQKEYRKLIKLLADFNRTHDIKIRWTGFFIFRPKEQMHEEDWKLTAESGALKLIVGVESFVDHIRYHLKKKFSNGDLEYGLEMASKYNVALQLLLIVGYVTETDQDHQEQLEWVRKHTHYRNVIQTINVGSTLAILPGTWLHSNQKNLNIRMNSTEVFQDWTREEINSTPEIRMARHRELVDELKINGYNVVVEQDNHVLIESYIRNYHE